LSKKNLSGSVFISGLIFLWAFLMMSDHVLMVLVFIFAQVIMNMAAFFMILFRLIRIVKNKSSFIYCLTGIFQIFLAVMDILLLFNRSLIKQSLLIFLGINLFLGTCIFADIYNKPGDQRDRR
jgi:hypothetical protein